MMQLFLFKLLLGFLLGGGWEVVWGWIQGNWVIFMVIIGDNKFIENLMHSAIHSLKPPPK